jgi:hypothetical protein
VTILVHAVVGALVQKDSNTDNNWYIIPVCNKHNKEAAIIEIYPGTNLVSANVSKTCGKAI